MVVVVVVVASWLSIIAAIVSVRQSRQHRRAVAVPVHADADSLALKATTSTRVEERIAWVMVRRENPCARVQRRGEGIRRWGQRGDARAVESRDARTSRIEPSLDAQPESQPWYNRAAASDHRAVAMLSRCGHRVSRV